MRETDELEEGRSPYEGQGTPDQAVEDRPSVQPNTEHSWSSRRKMAWVSLLVSSVFGVGLSIAGLFSNELADRVEKMSFLTTTLVSLWGGIVAAYFGTRAWVHAKERKLP